jgi:hypothetical protein
VRGLKVGKLTGELQCSVEVFVGDPRIVFENFGSRVASRERAQDRRYEHSRVPENGLPVTHVRIDRDSTIHHANLYPSCPDFKLSFAMSSGAWRAAGVPANTKRNKTKRHRDRLVAAPPEVSPF